MSDNTAVGAPGDIRRVVTTVDDRGISHVSIDGPVQWRVFPSGSRFGGTWQTNESPTDAQAEGDGAQFGSGALVNRTGSNLGFFDYSPNSSSPMHRTDSVDYGILLYGELELELDDGSVTVIKQHDVVVQRAGVHKWYNKTDKWARMVFVMLPAKPIVVDGKVLDSMK